MLLTADPKAGFLAHESEIRAAIERVLASGHYILGPEVEAFEREFSAYLGNGHAVGVANGTEALELALRALGVVAGDAVATVANTVTATVSAVEQIGARPVFVEIDAQTMTMNATALEQTLAREGGRVRVVVPVHLYGQPADLPEILAACGRHGAKVLEDCAQSHGAAIAGRKTGCWGAAAAFSFYPTKNLGALGDGGAVFTRDAALAQRVRAMRQYGWRTRYIAESTGRNSRLDELQAAILRVKLTHLDAENAQRRVLAARYLERLSVLHQPVVSASSSAQKSLALPRFAPDETHALHQFAIRAPQRESLRQHLLQAQIAAGVLYPAPVYRQPAFAAFAPPAPGLLETERACAEVLCLPCHPALTAADVDRVCGEILRWAAAP